MNRQNDIQSFQWVVAGSILLPNQQNQSLSSYFLPQIFPRNGHGKPTEEIMPRNKRELPKWANIYGSDPQPG